MTRPFLLIAVLTAFCGTLVIGTPALGEPVQQAEPASLQQVQSLVHRAQVLSLTGSPAQAADVARQAIDLASRIERSSELDALVMTAVDLIGKTHGEPQDASAHSPAPAAPPQTAQQPAAQTVAAIGTSPAGRLDRRSKVFSPEALAAYDSVMDQIRRDTIPQAQLLHVPYPKKLADVQPNGSSQQRIVARTSEPWEDAILMGLEQRVSFEFKGARLGEAVDYLSALTKQNILLDPRVGAQDTPIHLQVRDMKLSSALRWLTRMAGLEFAIRREAIFLSSSEYLEGENVMRVYDISDLTLNKHDFAGTDTAASTVEKLGMDAYQQLPDYYRIEADKTGRGWADFIRGSVVPSSWRSETNSRSQGTISYRGGQLVVTNVPGVHQKIEQLLAAFREARALMVSIQVRFLDVSNSFLEQIGVNWVNQEDFPTSDRGRGVLTPGGTEIPAGFQSPPIGNDDPVPPPASDQHQPPYQWEAANVNIPGVSLVPGQSRVEVGGLFLDWMLIRDFQVRMLLDAVQRQQKGSLLTAPRITCFNTQRANIVVADEINYVSSQSSADEPEISTVADGVLLEVQPFVSADRKYVTIEMRPSLNDLIALGPLTYSSQLEVQEGGTVLIERRIQLPEISRRGVECTIVVPVGGTLLIGGLSRSRDTTGYAGVPFLSQLPIIKRLFRTDATVNEQTSLLILVRADLIEPELALD